MKLAETDRLSAKFGEAWVRQQLVKRKPILPMADDYPWENKPWWKKERTQQALMQIAASQRQRMIWAGCNDVVALSGGNILVFVSLCQQIWAAWMRSVRGEEHKLKQEALPSFDYSIQNEGIQNASRYWFGKITERSNGEARQRFTNHLGTLFRRGLLNDFRMSYPGGNGFSLAIGDLEQNEDIEKFLNDSVDYGVLVDRPHTTKNKARERRKKWYLNPILSPHFEVPAVHTKEPRYVSVKDVREWLVSAQVIEGELSSPKEKGKKKTVQEPADQQLPLFEYE